MAHTICTFNVNNLFVRYRFGDTFPGDISRKSATGETGLGFLPMYNPGLYELFNPSQRELAALALTRNRTSYPDVVCFQEVESLLALREFNERHLAKTYPYALLVDGRDLRGIDVGILSKLEILRVRSHVDDVDKTTRKPLFSRDCLEVDIALNKSGSKRLTLFINHLKSKLVDFRVAKTPEKRKKERQDADKKRRRQADAVLSIIRERFPGPALKSELYAVVGDFNDEPLSPPVRGLVGIPLLENVLNRIPKPEERWTYWFNSENQASQIDYILASPALSAATKNAVPEIERRGIPYSRVLANGKPGPQLTHYVDSDAATNVVDVNFQFTRFPAVSPAERASDHCPVFFEVP